MDIALIILPIFALILLGWGIKHQAGLAEVFWRDLEKLIYFVFFPALLFHSLSHAEIDFAAAWPMLVTGILFTLAGMGLGWLSQYLFHDPPAVFAAAFQCSFRFNSYVMLAAAAAMHGKAGIAAVGLLMGFLVPLATAGGVTFSLAGLELPNLADHALELLARASLPLGLIAVGAGLRFDVLDHARGHLWYGVTVKLVFLPAIAWAIASAFGLTGLWFQMAILLAAQPVSTVAYVLAVRMRGDGRIIAAQVAVTTLLSMVTLPFWPALARG